MVSTRKHIWTKKYAFYVFIISPHSSSSSIISSLLIFGMKATKTQNNLYLCWWKLVIYKYPCTQTRFLPEKQQNGCMLKKGLLSQIIMISKYQRVEEKQAFDLKILQNLCIKRQVDQVVHHFPVSLTWDYKSLACIFLYFFFSFYNNRSVSTASSCGLKFLENVTHNILKFLRLKTLRITLTLKYKSAQLPLWILIKNSNSLNYHCHLSSKPERNMYFFITKIHQMPESQFLVVMLPS